MDKTFAQQPGVLHLAVPQTAERIFNLTSVGRVFFAMAMVVFGLQYFVLAISGRGPVVGPPWSSGNLLWAYFMGYVLLGLGVSIAFTAWARWSSLLLALVLLLHVLVLYAPQIAANLHDPRPWTRGFEILAMCGGALVIAGNLRSSATNAGQWNALADKIIQLGPAFIAVSMVIFGIQHCIYGPFVAGIVPSWIPARLFWAYFCGIAFFAAAAGILFRIWARLAATLLGSMFLLWVLVLHLPRLVHALDKGNEWTSAFVALTMSGTSFALTGVFPGKRMAMKKAA